MERYFVDCTVNGVLIASYYFDVPHSLAGPGTPDQDHLVEQAKAQLANEGKAHPPFAGVRFRVRRD